MDDRNRRPLVAAIQVLADVAIVLLAAWLLSVPIAILVALALAFFFVRWWRRSPTQ
jgi:hypothetical protein